MCESFNIFYIQITPEDSGATSRGSWSYNSPEGEKIALTFVADENGFQPQGAHLPVAPEPSPAIKRALAIIARTNAADEARATGYEHQTEAHDARTPQPENSRVKYSTQKQQRRYRTNKIKCSIIMSPCTVLFSLNLFIVNRIQENKENERKKKR